MAELPLLRRFPALAVLPRARFGEFPTRVDALDVGDGRTLLLKRDDLSARVIGGNKVRGLEWLLGSARSGDRLLTVGARGSTHALSTALLGSRLGASTTVVRWDQVMNPAAREVEARIRAAARVVDARLVPAAYAIAGVLRATGMTWIPAGGVSRRAILGHVNAGLELAGQVERGECPRPDCIFLPLGTGGTAAGLSLGLAIADLRIPLVLVRVVPSIVARRGRVLRLANGCARLIEIRAGRQIPRVSGEALAIEHRYYAGGYGRALPDGARLPREALDAMGVALDDTYGRKAFTAALESTTRFPMVWLTFDGRLLRH